MATRNLNTKYVNKNTEKENRRVTTSFCPNKGLSNGGRKSLCEITQQEASKINARPPLKKTTSLKEVKKPTVPAHKDVHIKKATTHVHIKKPTNITAKPVCTKVKEEQQTDKKENNKILPYSVHKFGLVKETDPNPELVSVYINDIIAYLHSLEKECMVHEMFLVGHKITPRMRSILVNWLVDVHMTFTLAQETLYLAISILDRFLHKNRFIDKKNLQLVGTVALIVACKYEEMLMPEIDDFVYICDGLYPRSKILQMEKTIIKALDFKLGNPSSLHFLRRYTKISRAEWLHYVLSKYLLELTLLEYDYSYILPSLLASSALCMAVKLLNSDMIIISRIKYVSGYVSKDMNPVIKKLATTVLKQKNTKYETIKYKYSVVGNCAISKRIELRIGLIEELAGTKGKKNIITNQTL